MSDYTENRNAALNVVAELNRKYDARSTCFVKTPYMDDWRPTRLASPFQRCALKVAIVVKVDGLSEPVVTQWLALPDSPVYEGFIQDADEALDAHNTERFAADCSDGAEEAADDALFDQVIYHYAASVNLPQGVIHFDGILTVPPIKSIDDYRQYRAMIAADAKAQPEQVQVHSFCIVGAK